MTWAEGDFIDCRRNIFKSGVEKDADKLLSLNIKELRELSDKIPDNFIREYRKPEVGYWTYLEAGSPGGDFWEWYRKCFTNDEYFTPKPNVTSLTLLPD